MLLFLFGINNSTMLVLHQKSLGRIVKRKVIWRFIHTIKTKSLSKWVKVSKCKKVGFQRNPTFLLSTIFEIIYFCSLSHKSAYFTKVEWAESTASRKPCFPSKKPAFKMYILTKQPIAWLTPCHNVAFFPLAWR